MIRVLAVAVLALVAAPVPAESYPCYSPREEVVAGLRDGYGERQLGFGATVRGDAVVELWVGETTFTIVLSLPDGRVCFVAAGTEWVPVFPVRGEKS